MTHPNYRRPPTNRKVDPDRFAALAKDGLPLRRIAAALSVHPSTARNWHARLGLPAVAAATAPPANRKVDPAEFAALAAVGHPLERIAAAFGISETTSRRWREKLGLRGVIAGSPPVWTKPTLGPAERDAVSASGNHKNTARELGVDPSTVRAWRIRLGLPAVPEAEMIARRTRGARDRHKAARELARGYGLPADITPRELSVLLALLDGPADFGGVAAALGSRPSRVWRSVWAMKRAGLVASLPGDGSRRIYCLTAAALDLIAGGAGVPQ